MKTLLYLISVAIVLSPAKGIAQKRAPQSTPAEPSNLTATLADYYHIELSWVDNADDEAGFRIERRVGADGVFDSLTTVKANVTTYIDWAQSPATEYCYRVRAFRSYEAVSEDSGISCITTRTVQEIVHIVLEGQVFSTTGQALDRVRVELPALDKSFFGDPLGRFWVLRVLPGTYEVQVSSRGYETQVFEFEFNTDRTIRRSFTLQALAEKDTTLALQQELEGRVVRGRVRSARSGTPIADVGVTTSERSGWTRTNANGEYVIDRLSADSLTVRFRCPGTVWRVTIAEESIAFAEGDVVEFNVDVQPGTCWEPPFAHRSGLVFGRWERGFELSEFTPCPGGLAGLQPAPSLEETAFMMSEDHGIWAEMSELASQQVWRQEIVFPSPRPGEYNNPVFVIGYAVVTGPGRYGHMGMSAFRLDIEDLFEVSRPSEDSCEKALLWFRDRGRS